MPLVFSRADAVIIHAYETYIHFGVLHWLLRRSTPIVYHYDGTYTADGLDFGSGIPGKSTGFGGRLQRIALNRTTLFVPFSEFTERRTVDAYSSAAARSVVLSPGIDLEKWTMRPDHSPGDRFKVLFVGSDALRKGLDIVVDAFELGLAGHCDLDVVTDQETLPADLRRRLEALPCATLHFDVSPGTTQMLDFYRSADAVALPTRLDLTPFVPIEAMATGVPVVASAVGALPEIVIDGSTGLLIERDDPEGLLKAIETLRTDDALRVRLAAGARQHVEEHFDAAANGARLIALTKGLVDERRHRK